MSLTNTHVVFICFAFLCILMGMQYTIYGGEENSFRNDFHFFLRISEIFGNFWNSWEFFSEFLARGKITCLAG